MQTLPCRDGIVVEEVEDGESVGSRVDPKTIIS
jgi:hypothetical protein